MLVLGMLAGGRLSEQMSLVEPFVVFARGLDLLAVKLRDALEVGHEKKIDVAEIIFHAWTRCNSCRDGTS